MARGIKIIGTLLLLLLFYFAGFWVGQESQIGTPPIGLNGATSTEAEIRGVDFSVFWEAWRDLTNDFFDKNRIDYQKMVYGAIKGMVESLDDPYTVFFTPKEAKEFDEELSGKYEGVGMEVAIKDKILTVVSPLEGTPAKKAGLMPGDKILKIEDKSTENMPLEKAVMLIRGKRGTKVRLSIIRESWQKPKEVILQRDIINIPTIKLTIKKDKKGERVAILKMYEFNRILLPEFRKIAPQLRSLQSKKIILDLRNNPGGFLDVVQGIAGWFLKRNDVVAWQDFGNGKKRKIYKSEGPSVFANYKIIALINGGSASAAEILAGALRDNNKVKLIGEKSFGKGSVQEQIYLSNNSSLKITIAKWLTPNGYSIDKVGLKPNIEIKEKTEKNKENNNDLQLEKALEIISRM